MGGFHGGRSNNSSGGFHGGVPSSSHSSHSSHSSSSSSHSSSSRSSLRSYHSTSSFTSGEYKSTTYSYSDDDNRTVTSSGGTSDGSKGLFIFLLMASGIFFFGMILLSNWDLVTKIVVSILIFGVFFGICAITGVQESARNEEIKEALKEIGDLNGDGVVDQKDLLLKNQQDKEKREAYLQNYNKFIVVERVPTKNKNLTRALRIFGYVALAFGVLCYFFIGLRTVDATITKAKINTPPESEPYEVYEFEYQYKGKEYKGYGDDDIVYDINGNMMMDINVGDVYTLYINPFDAKVYKFQDDNRNSIVAAILFVIGGFSILLGIVLRRKYLVSIQYVGDQNEDGRINESDLFIYSQAQYQKLLHKNEMKKAVCPYCGKPLKKEQFFCPNCGARKEITDPE